jgi:hypothetical protein
MEFIGNNMDGIEILRTEKSKVSQRAVFLVLELVAIKHVKQQQYIWLELSNAFYCVSDKRRERDKRGVDWAWKNHEKCIFNQ